MQDLQRKNIVRRRVIHGTDHAGTYDIDTSACTLNYNQDWYFNFGADMEETSRNSYMASAERQVETVWSHKHPINPLNKSCPCHDNGFDVAVDLNTHAEGRRGRHGYSVDVNDEGKTAFTNQPTRQITLDTTHQTPVSMGSGLTQLNIPASLTVGLRENGFQVGVNYTAMFDVLDRGSFSHIVGVNLSFDIGK